MSGEGGFNDEAYDSGMQAILDEDNLEDLDMEIQQLRAGDANLQQLWSCS